MASSTSVPPLGVNSPVAFSKDGVQLTGVITAVNYDNNTYTIQITSIIPPATGLPAGFNLAVGNEVDEAHNNVHLHDTNMNHNMGPARGGRRRKRKTSKKSKKSKRSRKSVRK